MYIRVATQKDVPVMSRILCHSWKEAYRGMVPKPYLDSLPEDHWTALFHQWLAQDSFTMLLAEQDGAAMGCIAYGNARDASHPDWTEISILYVLPEYHAAGCGSALLRAAVTATPRDTCYLWALTENTRARKFYEARGFVPTADTYVAVLAQKELVDIRYVLTK